MENKWMHSFAGNPCLASSVVGFCHNSKHRGYITKTLLKSHECIAKECVFLRKLNIPYWETLQRANEKKLEARINKEKQRQTIIERNAFIREVFSKNPNIHVTAIREEKGYLVIYYIHEGYVDLSNELQLLRTRCEKPVRMNAVFTTQSIADQLLRGRNVTEGAV